MAPTNPVAFLDVPPPSTPTSTPTIAGGILFGSIFILLLAGCFYYANVCYRTAPSSSNSGSRVDFFHNFPTLRSAFVRQPTASNHPPGVRADIDLRSFNLRFPPTVHSPNARAPRAVPPPYEHPPSYEASISDHTGSSHSPISPSSPASPPWERSTANRNDRDSTS